MASDPDMIRRLDLLESLLRIVVRMLTEVSNKGNDIMVALADIQAKANQELAQITSETDLVNSVKLVVEGQNERLSGLQARIDELIAAGTPPTQEELQQLSDTLDAIRKTDLANADVVAKAVAAGTTPPVATP